MKSSNKFKIFLEMIKFEHSIFALPFAYLGLVIGERGLPRPHIFTWVTIAMVSFRTMGMALNRLIDIQIDSENPRTKNRALPSKQLKSSFVWILTFASFLIFILSAYQLGPMCLILTPIPTALAILYPFTKRFTWFSHFVLGCVLGSAPYGAWMASRLEFSWIPGLLSLGVICWVAGFDIIYALQDETFDRGRGLFSIPAKFGAQKSVLITRFLHIITVVCWTWMGFAAHLHAVYFAGLVLVCSILIREHWLIKNFGLSKIQEAFFSMNALVSLTVFLSVFLDFLLKGNSTGL